MKINKIFAMIALGALFCSCDQKLPYDLEGTKHGVLISISKVQGTSGILSTDMNAGNYQVKLDLPIYQGDYSMLEDAQIMAVYTGVDKTKKSAIVAEGIKAFPDTVKLNIKDVASKLGISEINVGDKIEYTPCYTLKDGLQVNGWSELTGFNNKNFSSWKLEDGSSFAYRVSYTAFAPLQLDKFQCDTVKIIGGNPDVNIKVAQIDSIPDAAWIPAGTLEDDLVALNFVGDIFYGEDDPADDSILMWINLQDYSLIIPDQVVIPNWTYAGMTFDAQMLAFEGELDTLYNTITISFSTRWGPYTFGDGEVSFQFPL